VGLAVALDVKPASVTNMLQKMDDFQPRLVNYQKHHGVSLTANGEKEALRIIRRHRLIEQFLFEVLGYSWDKVHSEAEELEHVITPYFEDRMAIFLGEPAFDPHGEPIPKADGTIVETADRRLADCTAGERFHVSRVTDQSPEFLRYLSQAGVEIGASCALVTNEPAADRVTISIAGKNRTLSREMAGKLMVR
jgi:DtxR family Mn-dependent transcriptional regulator